MEDPRKERARPRAADYLKGMQVKSTDLEPITSVLPSYNDAKPIARGLRQNLIHIPSDVDEEHGCLYLIKNTATTVRGRVKLMKHPGTPPVAEKDKDWEHTNAMIEWHNKYDRWMQEQEVTKAMIEWLLELIPEDIIRGLHDPEYKYRKVKLETIYTTFVATFQAEPEDIQALQMDNQAKWDPSTGLQNMMNEIQNNLRDIAEMNQEKKYTDKSFIQTAYLKIAGTHQFVKQCDSWKAKDPADRKTEVQFREFWTKEYKLWHKKQHSLQQLGIANSVQSQQTIQDLQREVAEAKEEARIAMSLATQQKEEATVATANSTISSITEAITAATNNSKQPSNNDVVST